MSENLKVPVIPFQGRLVLIGGGEFSHGYTEEVDRYLVGLLEDNPRVAFLPTASGSSEYAGHFGEYLRKLDGRVEVENVPVYRSRDARRNRNVERIRSAGMVYLGGGVVNHILDTIAESPVEEAIRSVIEQGGVVAGIGAGAAAFGDLARSMVTHGAPVKGLGWLRDSFVEPGFTGEASRTLHELILKRRIGLGLGIPAGTALSIGPEGSAEIVGAGNVAVLRAPEGA